MNPESLAALKLWMDSAAFANVADLGSLNLNGSVKQLLPHAVGFDVVPGPGVDVLLTPGFVPMEYRESFDLVTAIGSLQCAPDVTAFKDEAILLLKPGGYLYILTCTPMCTMKHTAPEGAPDRHRFNADSLRHILAPEFGVVLAREVEWHPVIECVARKSA